MLAGVVFQLVSLTIYSLMGAEFLIRHRKNKPFNNAHAQAMGPTKPVLSSRVKLMLWGLAQMDIYLFTRYVFFPWPSFDQGAYNYHSDPSTVSLSSRMAGLARSIGQRFTSVSFCLYVIHVSSLTVFLCIQSSSMA